MQSSGKRVVSPTHRPPASDAGGTPNREALLQACASGDQTALHSLYMGTAPQLFGLAVGILRSRELAEEIVQDSFLRVWRNAHAFDPARGSAMAWLASVVRNRCIDVLRQRGPVDRLWDNLGFWRGAAALAAATAAALVLYIALLPPSVRLEQIAGEIAAIGERLASVARQVDAVASRPTHVAVLLDKDQRPMMTADLDVADGRLVLRLNLTPPRDFTTNVLQVWLVSPDGTSSLGILPSERPGTTTALVLPHDTAEALAKAALAVSLEPRGGSTTGQPSGPVLFTGGLMSVRL